MHFSLYSYQLCAYVYHKTITLHWTPSFTHLYPCWHVWICVHRLQAPGVQESCFLGLCVLAHPNKYLVEGMKERQTKMNFGLRATPFILSLIRYIFIKNPLYVRHPSSS